MKRFMNSGWIFVIVLVVCIIIYIFPWQHKIDTTIQGVQWRIGDADYSEDVLITVKGIYKQYLFKDDVFEGKISIDIYDFSLDVPIIPAHFDDGYASLIYHYDFLDMRSFGTLSCTPNFDQLFIGLHEPIDTRPKGWNGDNGLNICAPANNRTQALETAKILSKKSKLFSKINWN